MYDSFVAAYNCVNAIMAEQLTYGYKIASEKLEKCREVEYDVVIVGHDVSMIDGILRYKPNISKRKSASKVV